MRRCAHVEVPQLLTLQARNAVHFKVQPHAVRAIGAVYRKAFLGPIHDHMERQVFSRHWLYHFPLVWDALAPLARRSDGTIPSRTTNYSLCSAALDETPPSV